MQIVIDIPEKDIPKMQSIMNISLHFLDGQLVEYTAPSGWNIEEQETCEDIISRKDAVNACWNGWGHDDETIKHIESNILKLPPVIPQPNTWQWIPVSERLPEENKTVIASTKYGVYPEAKYTKRYGWEWAYEAGADYWKELEYVTAWMPLPEPYKPESEE